MTESISPPSVRHRSVFVISGELILSRVGGGSGYETAKLGVIGCLSKGDGATIPDKEKSDTDSKNPFIEHL